MIMATETVSKKLFTVEEFHRMSELGILPDNKRFELIRGEIIEMPRPLPPHSGRVNRLNHLLMSKVADRAILSIQNPSILDEMSEPEPDVCLLKPRPDFYTEKHPTPTDILLLIEVAHTTVHYDTRVKAPLYAETGISEYWIVNIPKNVLEVRSDPVNGEYTRFEISQWRDRLAAQLPRHFLPRRRDSRLTDYFCLLDCDTARIAVGPCPYNRCPMWIAALIFLLALTQTAPRAQAQELPSKVLDVPRIAQPPVLQDFLQMKPATEAASRMAKVSGFLQRSSRDGEPATQPTDVYAVYDASNLYFVFVCFDSEPEKVRARMFPRGASFSDDSRGYFTGT